MSDINSLSLGQLFQRGQSLLNEIEESPLASIDKEYQDKVQSAITYLKRADELISKLNIFSDNELIDDINTNDLKFLLTTAYLGNLTLKLSSAPAERSTVLEKAKVYIQRFLSMCQDHELMKKEDTTIMQQLETEGGRLIPVAQQREQKIAKFKRERSIKNQIQQLRTQLDELSSKHNGEDEDRDVDEAERDWIEALIQLEIMRSLEHWHGIKQELVMVKEMEIMREMMAKTGETPKVDERIPLNTRETWGKDKPILSQAGKPLQPFVITNKREQLKNQVFGYGHNLPTMTIDEYLEQEMERGNIIKGGGEPPEKPPVDDNDYAALDAETMKKREWDAFTDDNPRGAGNRGNKG
ncbi:TAP42-like protein [Pilobolus umbonatus]|nr:TAP42-like protein [Pilobolus umbonatus]